jgi:hypothetical protein
MCRRDGAELVGLTLDRLYDLRVLVPDIHVYELTAATEDCPETAT